MSELLVNKLNTFQTFKVDSRKKSIINLNCAKSVNFDDFFEISHILDSSYLNYRVDDKLNIIVLGKK